jgi:hypothetical protein
VCKVPIVVDFGKRTARTVPCGQCLECRLKRAREWAIRMMHEATLHEENSFITLTYSNEYLPEFLSKRDVQLFLKRYRKNYGEVRYYLSGEYAPDTRRPHYHSIFFGQSPDRRELEDVWQKGRCHSGNVTFRSCAYVAEYCIKSIAKDPNSPFALMSRRPGIGYGVLDKLSAPRCYLNGHSHAVPRYYRTHKDLSLKNFSVIENYRQELLAKMSHSFDFGFSRGKTDRDWFDYLAQPDLDYRAKEKILKAKAR